MPLDFHSQWAFLGLPAWLLSVCKVGMGGVMGFWLFVVGEKLWGVGSFYPSSCILMWHGKSLVVFNFWDVGRITVISKVASAEGGGSPSFFSWFMTH
ncbi:hypothetical protein Tco_0953545 [Tanacetum coccineum]|uniref:Uncharacterized protein n=1 Tax=Tanacetum coccineum TaxID=301880 RepID=A0ABQ5E0B6_9ASTR